MAVSERAIGNALGWPTPLACLYSIAMETGIRVRDYPREDGDTAAIVADGKVIAMSAGLADDGLRADVLAMALEVAIVMANRPGVLCPVGGFVVITRHRVPAPATGVGKFATLMARTWAGTPPPPRSSTTPPRCRGRRPRQPRSAVG
jgi:hypothetical protein